MEIGSLVLFGLLVGMQHALEADHLAAVAAMSARKSSPRHVVLRGAWWGIGHTLALFAICGAALSLGLVLTAEIEALLEFGVGLIIVGLGINVLFNLKKRQIHFHVHDHDGKRHVHAHAHESDDVVHDKSLHHHAHPKGGLAKAMAMGLVHGAAGSGALMVLVVAAAQSTMVALSYVLAFGAGSVIGMAALSFVASYPLKWLPEGAAWLNRAVLASIGIFALFIGGRLILENSRLIGIS